MPVTTQHAPAQLLSLVLRFLQDIGAQKSAAALKKELDWKPTNGQGQSLLDIYQTHLSASKAEAETDSDDESSDDGIGGKVESKANGAAVAESSSEGDSSSSEESSSESESSSSEESSSESESSSSEESSSESESSSSEESSSESESSEDSDSDSDSSSSSDESSSESESEDAADKVKNGGSKLDSSSDAKQKAVKTSGPATKTNGANGKNGATAGGKRKRGVDEEEESPGPKKKKETEIQRFQRIKREEVDESLIVDNGYMAKGGAESGYGFKAHQDLIVTRGKGFRTEKNKKKKGSYRGGQIDTLSHSIKFEMD
ncbi:hypothetical protein HK104_007550 [Borealophlyctis nickersoniae]|nr:hypothetical protein HK104_007550 [Borealophlyctis nickersoniae]